MAWKLVNPNITNDPSYLDPRLSDDESKISSNTTSLADNTRFLKNISVDITDTQFGAKSDGSDTIPAINAAINYVSSLGGGNVFIPAQTFTINPTATNAIILQSGVNIVGTGAKSILKVKDNNGDFETVMCSASNGSTYIENITLYNFKIDSNIDNNTSSTIASGSGPITAKQYMVQLYNFKNVTIDKCRFEPCSGVNTIILNGTACDRARVSNCFFYFKKRSANASYDNTAVYFNCTNHVAYGNIFVADVGQGAVTALESHRGTSSITNNIVNGFQTGLMAVSASDNTVSQDNNIVISSNALYSVNNGIFLWGYATTATLTNVVVSNNTINVDQVTHNQNSCSGIQLNNSTSAPGQHNNIVITGNTIKFKPNDQRTGLTVGSVYGIGVAPIASVNGVLIANNIIENSPIKGIFIGNIQGATYKNIKVINNILKNIGCNTAATIYERSYIALTGIIDNLEIRHNMIIDDFTPICGFNAIQAYGGSGTAYTNIVIKDNSISQKQGGLSTKDVPSSIVIGDPVNVKYSSTFPPTSGSFYTNDVVWNSGTMTAGTSYAGYRCTVPGTYGTLTGITGSTNSTGQIITVSDSSSLQVGQYVSFNGSGSGKIHQISGNTIYITGTSFPANTTGGTIQYYTPTLKGFGQLQA